MRYGGSAISAPLLGMFADKKQCHKKLVVFLCITSAFVNLLQPLTPLFLKKSNNSNKNITAVLLQQQNNTTNGTNLKSYFFNGNDSSATYGQGQGKRPMQITITVIHSNLCYNNPIFFFRGKVKYRSRLQITSIGRYFFTPTPPFIASTF